MHGGRAVIASCALGIRQTELDAETAAFFADAQPWAFILFREACQSKDQVRALTAALRESVGRDAIVWIDQEGGRVARMRPPEWPAFPSAGVYGALYGASPTIALEAARLGHRLIAAELKDVGVDGDYAPVLDRPIDGADPIIGDRAFSREPALIAALGREALNGLHAGGVVGCIKHMPGHGRAEADSHLHLPRVNASRAELAKDFAPFRALCDAPTAMTAHIVYEALDPDRPATCSPQVIDGVIRGEIGFQGLLMSDDLDMKALAQAMNGGLREFAETALDAGVDVVIQCNGKLDDMRATVSGCRALDGISLVRARAAERFARAEPEELDREAAWARFRELLNLNQGAVA
jgi:beta-N-acetylhexosaminidase